MITIEQLRASTSAVVTIKDAAELMGVNRRTMSGALSVHGGEIPARRIGRRIVIPREAFLRWYSGDEPAETAANSDSDIASVEHDPARVVRAKLIELLNELESA